jgi:hypothetical protein
LWNIFSGSLERRQSDVTVDRVVLLKMQFFPQSEQKMATQFSYPIPYSHSWIIRESEAWSQACASLISVESWGTVQKQNPSPQQDVHLTIVEFVT